MQIREIANLGKKLAHRIQRFIKRKKTFKPPQKAKILVFDGARLELLEPLFNDEAFEVYYTRGESINLSPIIIMRWILIFLRGNTMLISHAKAFIEHVQPSIIITFIDNNAIFQHLDANNANDQIKFIAIQNGNRSFMTPGGGNGIHPQYIYHSNFFCFGEYEVDEYRKAGAHVENFYPCGSLIDSYFRALPENKRLTESFDICIVISPWSQYSYDSPAAGREKQSFELMLIYLDTLQKHHGLTIAAASKERMGTELYKAEVDWIQTYLGTNVSCFPSDSQKWMNYCLTDNAKIVVGMASTLLSESFGRGKKLLQCNYAENPIQDIPFEGIWLLKEKGYEVFEKRILEILALSMEDYKKLCMDYPSYLFANNDEKPAFSLISEFIEQHIQSTKKFKNE